MYNLIKEIVGESGSVEFTDYGVKIIIINGRGGSVGYGSNKENTIIATNDIISVANDPMWEYVDSLKS